MIDLPKIETNKIAFKLTQKAEVLVKKGHPWVFDQSITKQSIDGKSGDLAILFDNRKNKFIINTKIKEIFRLMVFTFSSPISPYSNEIIQFFFTIQPGGEMKINILIPIS